MTITTMTSRELDQDTGKAKKAAKKGPLIIADRGKPGHVLLSIEEYRKLTGKGMSLLEALAQDGGDEIDIDFEPPRARIGLKPAKFV